METVIAVVGTMKAGKSTTINAIVGKEILPNRNDPMTTLPTLIRNKHGQVEPLLRLNEIKPLVEFNSLCGIIMNPKVDPIVKTIFSQQ
jgi:ribosome-binding ATPase YchF (GTP1/OBG family)